MAPRLRKYLGLADHPPCLMTLGLNGQVMAQTSQSQQTVFTVQYKEHLSPGQEWEVQVVSMLAHDLVFGFLWFQSRNLDVDWQQGRNWALQTTGGAEVVGLDRVDHQECPGNVPRSTAREEACSKGGGGIPDIPIL